MPAKTIPKLPLVCLKTADFKNTKQIVKGKNTVIDFWTTRCTQCPDALDKLDDMAQDPKYKDVQFISICCDKLDGARDFIERDDDLRWQNVNHYFMDKDDKETAKKLLGFKQVPFYVVMDENGSITQSGSGRQVDFEEVPGVVRPEPEIDRSSPVEILDHNKNFDDDFCIDFELDFDFDNNGNEVKLSPSPPGSIISAVEVLDDSVFNFDDF